MATAKQHLEILLQNKGWGKTLPRTLEIPPQVLPVTWLGLGQALHGGGLPRGHISEITGADSSGKTRFLLSLIAHATQQKEVAAWLDCNTLDPASAQRAGVDLTRLLWVRCPAAGEILTAADILCRAGNFGVIVLDLVAPISAQTKTASEIHKGDPKRPSAPIQSVGATRSGRPSNRRPDGRPLRTAPTAETEGQPGPMRARSISRADLWFRLQRAIEGTSTALLVMAERPVAGSAARLCLRLRRAQAHWCAVPSRWQCLQTISEEAEILKGRSQVVSRRSQMAAIS